MDGACCAMRAGRLVCQMQGGACYEEVHDLWQRVTKAEQAASQAASELCKHKDAARHATLELKVRPILVPCHLATHLLLEPV